MVYLINIALVLVEGWILQYNRNDKQKEKIFCILAGAQFVLLSGLRHSSVGADTWYYIAKFHEIGKHTWQEQWNNFWTGMLYGSSEDRDGGYYIFSKLLYGICQNEQFFLMILAIIILIPIAVFIYRNSSDKCLSFVIFACLFFQFFGITGIRQSIALMMVSICGYKFVKERKFIPYVLLILFFATFHKTVFIMLPFYFLGNIELKKYMRGIVAGVIALAFLMRDVIAKILSALGGYSYGSYEGMGRPSAFIFLMIGVAAFSLLAYDKLVVNNKDSVFYVNAIVLGTALLPLSLINPSLMRLCYYYLVFLVLLIPEIVNCFSGTFRKIVLVSGYAGMILLFAKNGLQYQFFWQ